ncbi:hypothetical protein MIMGU_mgv1a018232mg, partial [Erythranthe guttata]
MGSMAATPNTNLFIHKKSYISSPNSQIKLSIRSQKEDPPAETKTRREIILRSSEIAVLGAIFQFSGTKPKYLGVQKSTGGLALCPATNNCVSTSENITDLTHYAPPWNYNPPEGRGSKKPVSKEQAMEELLQV